MADYQTTIITRFEAITEQQDAAFKGSQDRLIALAEQIEETSDGFAKLKGAVDSTTDRIRLLGKRAAGFADAIDDGIADPMLRAKAAMILFDSQSKRTGGAVSRFRDHLKIAELRVDSFLGGVGRAKAGLLLLAGALGTAFVGAVGLAVKAIKKFAETDATTKIATDALKKSVDELQVALGSALVGGAGKAERSLGTMQVKVERLTAWINVNANAIHQLAIMTVKSVKTALDWTVRFVNGLRLVAAYGQDTLNNTSIALASIVNLITLGLLSSWHAAEKVVIRLAKLAVDAADSLGIDVADKLRDFADSAGSSTGYLDGVINNINADMERLKQGMVETNRVLADQHAWQSTIDSLSALGDGAVDATIIMNRLNAALGEAKEGKPPKAPKTKAAPGEMQRQTGIVPAPMFENIRQTKEAIEGFAAPLAPLGVPGGAGPALPDTLNEIAERAAAAQKKTDEFWRSFEDGAKDAGHAALIDFAGSFSQAMGVAIASGESMSSALGEVFKNLVAQAAMQFGQLFVLKGAALVLENPPLGIAMIAGGMALQGFGAGLAASGGGARGGASAATPAAALATGFMGRGGDESERTTIINVTIAGDRIRNPIIDIVNEGIRTRRVRAA